MTHPSGRVQVWRWRENQPPIAADDEVALEEPLEIRVAGRAVSITMRTPEHDEELALGFLVGEGVLKRSEDVEHVRRCERTDDGIDVIVSSLVALDFSRLTRHVFASSSCGVCGAATIDAVRKQFVPPGAGPVLKSETVHRLAGRLRASQPTFDKTGGLHGAGLFDMEGKLLLVREDVGRHNAVDKVVGHSFRVGLLPLSRHVLVVSGRASFEIVQKALAAGIPIVAAVSAPSSLAIELARESNITLIGFLRDGRFNVYTHPERITA